LRPARSISATGEEHLAVAKIRGFASVVYGLLVLESGITGADDIFHLVALTIVISIVLHSSTDVVVARGFDEQAETPAWHGVLRRRIRTARRR